MRNTFRDCLIALTCMLVGIAQAHAQYPSKPIRSIESGVQVSVPETWWAVLSPKGTPIAIINRLNADLAQILTLPDVQERYAGLGIFTAHTTPERVLDQVRIESLLIGKVLKAAGVERE